MTQGITMQIRQKQPGGGRSHQANFLEKKLSFEPLETQWPNPTAGWMVKWSKVMEVKSISVAWEIDNYVLD